MKKISLFEIFKIFFIIGIQLLGGGYVIVPLLKKYIVEERNWMSEEELIDYYAMSQCIPGIIAGNISICTGYRLRGFMGAVAAITGIIAPSFIAIIVLANILSSVVNFKPVKDAFFGIRISVIILVLVTIKDIWQKSVNSIFTYIMFFLILAVLLFLPVSPAIVIVFSALISLIFYKIKGVKND